MTVGRSSSGSQWNLARGRLRTTRGSSGPFRASLLAIAAVAGLAAVPKAGAAAEDRIAQDSAQPAAASARVRKLSVEGNRRHKPAAIVKASGLRVGQSYTRDSLDRGLRDIYATGFFADVAIRDTAGNLVIQVREAPIVRAVYYKGTSTLKRDRIDAHSVVRPGQAFARSQARKQAAVLIELYRRQGRFAAVVTPSVIQRDDNEVDLIFEVEEGTDSYIRKIMILGNHRYSDAEIRGIFSAKVASLRHLTGNRARYDPAVLTRDQEVLIDFYRSRGFLDFRVISAVAELTPDRRGFVVIYVVDEGRKAP